MRTDHQPLSLEGIRFMESVFDEVRCPFGMHTHPREKWEWCVRLCEKRTNAMMAGRLKRRG